MKISNFFLCLVAVGNKEMCNLLSIFHCGIIISSVHVGNLICWKKEFEHFAKYCDICET